MSPWTNVVVEIEKLAGGWFRCILRAQKGQGTQASPILYPIVDGVSNYQGVVGNGLYIWGAQLEEGTFPTSFIPTATAAATRPPDVWTIPTSAFPFNASEGTLFATARTAAGLPTVNQTIAIIDNGSWNDFVTVFRSSDGTVYCAIARSGVVSQLAIGVVADNTLLRVATAFDGATLRCCLNGGAVVSVASGEPVGVTTLRVGHSLEASNSWDGCISHLAEWPVALSDSGLQAITA
jgi:hypothetical protein